MTIDVIMPLITLIIGAILGFASTVYLKHSDAKQIVTEKILNQYFDVRNDLCTELSKLAILKESEKLDISLLSAARDKISALYFEHYDFLPKEVLDELNCLFVCLTNRKTSIFKYENSRIFPLPPSEIQAFIERITLVENFKYSALLCLRSKDDDIKRIVTVKCQARSVLVSLNKYFTMRHLMDWINYTTKPH